MPTTTNFGWTTPADTDLVKDGAAAIRTLAGNIDTSLVDLKGGTTGQFLSKNSNTDLDFVFATPASGGMTLISTTTLSGATTTLSSIPQTYNSLYIVVTGMTNNTSNKGFRLSPNDVTNLSDWTGVRAGTAVSTLNSTIYLSSGTDTLRTDADNVWTIQINNYTSSTSYKTFNFVGSWLNTSSVRTTNFMGGAFRSNTAITSLVFDVERTETFSGGTVLLYGVK